MASKITAVPQYVRGLIDARPFGIASVTEFGAVNNGRADCTAAFNAALASPARLVVVPPGFYRITAPLRIPCNTGKWILGLGGAKSVALTVAMPAGHAGRA
ncbi:MAG: glycosyl hydrolase family 28-related protein, partial [Gemmatimonadales bacterium]